MPGSGLDKADHSRNIHEDDLAGELFVTGEGDERAIEPADIQQGDVGDCYLLAMLAAVARAHPERIAQMVRANGDGSFTVTLYPDGEPEQVEVDNVFWVNSYGTPAYAQYGDMRTTGARNDELWVMVIEAAWAKLHGGYDDISGRDMDEGFIETLLQRKHTKVLTDDVTVEELGRQLEEAFAAKIPVELASRRELDSGPVRENHAYALDGAANGKFWLYNPLLSAKGRPEHLEGVDAALIKTYFEIVYFVPL